MNKTVGIIGGGTARIMASAFVKSGFEVLFLSQDAPCPEGANPASSFAGFAGCGLVFDLSEQDSLEHKRSTVAELDKALPAEAAIIVSTVALNVNRIAAAAEKRSRVVPAHVVVWEDTVEIVEIVKTMEASTGLYDEVKGILKSASLTVVDAPDALGGIFYRMFPLMPNISARLISRGTKAEDIDKAMKYGTNFTKEPLRMADAFGLDRVLQLLEDIYEETKNQAYCPDDYLREMVKDGKLGISSGEGFYTY